MLNPFIVEKPHLTLESCSDEKRRRCEHTYPVSRKDDLVQRNDAEKLGMEVKERWGSRECMKYGDICP